MSRIRRICAVGFMGATLALVTTPAFASWNSSIGSATDGFQSRRWSDESYSEIQFTGCTAEYGTQQVVVDMREDIPNWPDTDYGYATFTNCYTGPTAISDAHWNNLETGTYFFELTKVGTGGGLLDVNKVVQDDTLAD